MIGRASVVAALGNQLPERRFITIVGPGGIGKTMVALAAATTFHGRYRHGVRFVDLAPIAEGARVLGQGDLKIGAHGKPVLFLHPKDFCGTLVELEQA